MPEKENSKKVDLDIKKLLAVAKQFFIGYKIEILSLAVIAVVVVSTSLLASQRVAYKSRAEACNFPLDPKNVCNGRDPGWSTCDEKGRWGCDNACNYTKLPDTWCEADGQPEKKCENGLVKLTDNKCGAGGLSPTGSPSPGACSGKSGSICEGQGNNDGSVTVLNCTGKTQKYVCQENQEDLQTKEKCDAASARTDNFKRYKEEGLVNPGDRWTCSVTPENACGRAQADILLGGIGGSAVCWDYAKNCENCSQITPTPTNALVPSLQCPELGVSCTDDGSVKLSWTSVADTAGYRVFKKLANGTYHDHIWYTTDKNEISYEDAGVACNQGYSYLVEPFSQVGAVGSWPWPGEKSCTPKPITCDCPICGQVKLMLTTDEEITDVNSLRAGQFIKVKVIVSGTANYIEDIGIRILKDGLEVKNENAGRAGLSEWNSSSIEIGSGTYEIFGYLKIKGQWK